MKTFPILGSNGVVVPYDLVKQHEKQVMINHGGQSVDRIVERGGLDWVELCCVLNDVQLDRRTVYSEKLATKEVAKKVEDFVMNSIRDEIVKPDPKLRPCIVKLENDKNGFEVDAYFHGWANKSQVTSIVGGPENVVNYTVGIIEYEDGTIDECHPKNIKFKDRG